jgi:hypothetical protein
MAFRSDTCSPRRTRAINPELAGHAAQEAPLLRRREPQRLGQFAGAHGAEPAHLSVSQQACFELSKSGGHLCILFWVDRR